MGPREGLLTRHQKRLEVLLRTLLRVKGGAIRQWDLAPQSGARQQPIFLRSVHPSQRISRIAHTTPALET
jgi:hypothetical protein